MTETALMAVWGPHAFWLSDRVIAVSIQVISSAHMVVLI